MQISVKTDIDKVIKGLNYLERKAIPSATRNALNDTAFKVKHGLDGSTKQYMDRPSPFSQKPTLVAKASKTNLRARVFIKPKQLAYLRYIIEGKAEHGRTVPVKGKRNVYGNLPRSYVKTRKNKPSFFSGKPRGGGKNFSRPAGLYERTGKNKKGIGGTGSSGRSGQVGALKLHAVYKDTVKHRKIWPFHKIGKKIVRRHFARIMERELGLAINRLYR